MIQYVTTTFAFQPASGVHIDLGEAGRMSPYWITASVFPGNRTVMTLPIVHHEED